MKQYYLTPSKYAKKHHLSKMQVTRLIRAGKILAERVGKNWMIPTDPENLNQIGLEKTTSLQKWNKIIQSKLHTNLTIESSKDREFIYTRLHGLGLPHERCIIFGFNHFPAKKDLEIAIGRLGTPYWISAVPDPESANLNRLSKLRLSDLNSGWEFIDNLPEKEKYKIIVAQYANNPLFKGSALISPSGNGVAEFITGDRHYIMIRGFTLTDPMLFNQFGIQRYSSTISRAKQKHLYHLVRGIFGHLEFQYGTIGNHKSLSFFDFNDDKAYVEIDHVWQDLIDYSHQRKKNKTKFLYGLPASPGTATGRCVVIHHEDVALFAELKKGDILVSDTTTPEMTTLLGKASAIITDLGGVTSHAAIVCRELKIPAVVGCITATDKLRTGDKIHVDADKGEIKIIDQKR